MKTVALVFVAACGAPLLAGAPHPNNAAVAGVAAATAAAITLAHPTGAQVPEDKINENTKPQDVHESVPADVLDRLDEQHEGGSAAPSLPPPAARSNGMQRVPSPEQAAQETQPAP